MGYKCIAVSNGRERIGKTNMGFQKNIVIRSTVDDWQTYQESPADFVGATCNSSTNIDDFGFSLNFPYEAENLQFAISYQVCGEEYCRYMCKLVRSCICVSAQENITYAIAQCSGPASVAEVPYKECFISKLDVSTLVANGITRK